MRIGYTFNSADSGFWHVVFAVWDQAALLKTSQFGVSPQLTQGIDLVPESVINGTLNTPNSDKQKLM